MEQTYPKTSLASLLTNIFSYLLPIMLLVGIGFILIGAGGRDDAHITYWPAYSLANFGEISNYNNIRVEQSSSLLQVILIAVFAKISGLKNGLDIVILGRLSSIFWGAASVFLIMFMVSRNTNRAIGFTAAILTALSPYFVYWSFGGLETTLVSFTSLLLIITTANYLNRPNFRSLTWFFFSAILLELVRPEMPIILGGILIGASTVLVIKKIFFDKIPYKEVLTKLRNLFLAYAIVTCSIFVFRFWYFGDWFPQPVNAKISGISITAISEGFTYLFDNLKSNNLIAIQTTIILISTLYIFIEQIKGKEPNYYWWFSLFFVFVYLSFVIFSGGDWMEGGRFLVPFLALAIFFIPLAWSKINVKGFINIFLFISFIGIETFSLISFVRYTSTGTPIQGQIPIVARYEKTNYSWFETRNKVNMRDTVVIQQLDSIVDQLVQQNHTPVVIMSGQMGIIPYYLSLNHFGKIRFIDRRGLAEPTFTDCSVTQILPRISTGLVLLYDFYFQNLEKLEQQCQIPEPDIIYELHLHFMNAIIDNGYTVIYTQSGYMLNDTTNFQGAVIPADQFIAVRTDLLELLNNPQPVLIRFGEDDQP